MPCTSSASIGKLEALALVASIPAAPPTKQHATHAIKAVGCSTKPPPCISLYLPVSPLELRMISLHLPAKGDGATFLRGATNIITTSQGEQNTQLKALVAELVVLMNAYAADSAEDRAKTEYRGGPFLPRNREHWPRSLIALWDALIKVCLPSLTLKPSPTHLPLNLPLNLLSR